MVRSALRIHEGHLFLTDHLLEVIQLGGANDGGCDLLRAPGKRDLCHLYIMFFGEFLDARSRHSINGGGADVATHRSTMVLLASLDL